MRLGFWFDDSARAKILKTGAAKTETKILSFPNIERLAIKACLQALLMSNFKLIAKNHFICGKHLLRLLCRWLGKLCAQGIFLNFTEVEGAHAWKALRTKPKQPKSDTSRSIEYCSITYHHFSKFHGFFPEKCLLPWTKIRLKRVFQIRQLLWRNLCSLETGWFSRAKCSCKFVPSQNFTLFRKLRYWYSFWSFATTGCTLINVETQVRSWRSYRYVHFCLC